ncbi:FadR/GntR family transcriptional regulator [Anaerotignum sp. MB30-C6]|uniref:FadR/GntR family transcriptional regulator n=1 Tax=Anaerotignum sp. MB30-C6 TaxID=3070814 RepID=UPI0027DBDC61|nr:FadR/GntR family transcriptional regulator [Anaerotignum sp. MB30-C6]WMI81157.1 FadR/GntR family transcriptional regulator [Anaerotignum sp. MB30-C6]
MERDYLAENVAYLTNDLGKCNISQNLFQRFKELIMGGQLPAGYMLPNENIVSDMLSVGRSTLREAYTALAVFGFIRRSKAGTFVNEIDNIVNIAPFSITVENSDLGDLLEFRYMLEAETASYAAKRATPEDIADLTFCYEKMIESKNDVNLFVDYDSMFHMQVSAATHNKLLMSTMIAAKESFEKGIRLALRESLTQNPRAIDVTIDLHGKLLNAIKSGDYQTAYAVMREHISYVNLTVKYG